MESKVSYIRDNRQIIHKVYLPYTSEEDAVIKKYFPTHDVTYCVNKLREELNSERTYNSVKDRANKVLKLHCSVRFTKESGFDLVKFKELYEGYGSKACMDYFNLSQTQVFNIARRNNIKNIKNQKKKTISNV